MTEQEYIKEFGDYLNQRGKSCNTVIGYIQAVKPLLKMSGKTPETLTYRDITTYTDWMKKNLKYCNKRLRLSAIKKYIRYLKFRYKSTIYDTYLDEVDTTGEDIFFLKEKHTLKPKDTLTVEESRRILDVSKDNPRNYAILQMFFHSWQRVNSIQNLNTSDIDLVGQVNPEDNHRYHKIHITAKNNISYDIYIETEAIDAIKAYLKVREEPEEGYILNNYGVKLYHRDALFLNQNGRRLQHKAISNMMTKYAVKAKINKKIHTHLWRASGITISESNGVSLSQIMGRSGHTNLQSIKPYLNPKKDETNRKIRSALNSESESNPVNVSELQDRIKQLERELEDK